MNRFFPKLALLVLALVCTAAAAQDLSTPKAVQDWYRAWETHDWGLLEHALGDGFTFSSPLDDHIDVQHVKDRCWPNTYKIKKFDVEQVVIDGDNVFVISTAWTTSGKFARNADYFQLKNGKIQAYECFFGPGINYPNSGK
ncbi:MAG TPA: nuclear transport factor 2 family protein [Lacunisphaera sp.]|nr:nuclear transport factor 2 family protein [Lacunisphaera sp.]